MTSKRWLWGLAGLLVAVVGWLLWRALNQAGPPAEVTATPAAPPPWTLTWTATAEPVTVTPSPLPPTVTPTWTVTVTATGTATRTDTSGHRQTPTVTVEKPAELPVTGADLGE